MTPDQREWSRARDELVEAAASLGFPKELGDAMAKNLGSPKAMRKQKEEIKTLKAQVKALEKKLAKVKNIVQ